MRGFIAVAVGLLLASCAGEYSAPRFCETLAEQQCKFLYECCNGVERGTVLAIDPWSPQVPIHGTRDQCVSEYSAFYCTALSPLSDADREGRAKWNAAEARRCWGFVEEAAKKCDARSYLLGITDQPDCALETLITGTVANGGECFIAQECSAAGSECVPDEPTDPEVDLVTAAGTCQGPPVAGEPCLTGGVCAAEFWCERTATPPTCRDKKADGQPCADASECLSNTCGAGGTCDPLKANGEECLFDGECESGFCDAQPNPAVCADRRANGDACTYAAQCQSGTCGPDLVCIDASAASDTVFAICEG